MPGEGSASFARPVAELEDERFVFCLREFLLIGLVEMGEELVGRRVTVSGTPPRYRL